MSREIGDRFETEVANLLNLKKTAKSGAHWDNGDLYTTIGPLKDFVIECKFKNIRWLQPNRLEIIKLQQQAIKAGHKDWLYIQKNQAGTFVVLSIDAFSELLNSLE